VKKAVRGRRKERKRARLDFMVELLDAVLLFCWIRSVLYTE